MRGSRGSEPSEDLHRNQVLWSHILPQFQKYFARAVCQPAGLCFDLKLTWYCHVLCIVMYCQDQELICAVKIDLSTHSLTVHSIFDSSAHSKCTIRSGVGGGVPITSQKSACTNELKNACTNEVLIYCLLSSLHQWDGSWDETMGKI